MSEESGAIGPVRDFCTDLRHLVRVKGLSAAAAARRLHISRSQYYAVINGDVRRPPDWSKIETIVRMCDEDDAAVSGWRKRHDQMVYDYERRRSNRRDTPEFPSPAAAPVSGVPGFPSATAPANPAPATSANPAPSPAPPTHASPTPSAASPTSGSPAPSAALPTSAGPVPAQAPSPALAAPAAFLPARLSGRRLLARAGGVLALIALAAGAGFVAAHAEGEDGARPASPPSERQAPRPLVIASAVVETGPLDPPVPNAPTEPNNKADDNESRACYHAAPGPGKDLLTVEHHTLEGNRKINNDWWGNTGKIAFNGYHAHAFDANVYSGTTAAEEALILTSCVPIVQGRWYELEYTAAANPGVGISVRVQDSIDYRDSHTEDIRLTPQRRPHSATFQAAKTSNASELMFRVGGQPVDFRLAVTGITLTEIVH